MSPLYIFAAIILKQILQFMCVFGMFLLFEGSKYTLFFRSKSYVLFSLPIFFFFFVSTQSYAHNQQKIHKLQTAIVRYISIRIRRKVYVLAIIPAYICLYNNIVLYIITKSAPRFYCVSIFMTIQFFAVC